MALYRLGKQRESTHFTAEQYKDAVREYLEALGFAQLTDSRHEAHLGDMTFVPIGGKTPIRELWVEAKAQSLSSTNSGLKREMRDYLKRWLTKQKEFELVIAIRDLKNPSRWEELFEGGASQSKLISWLEDGLDEDIFTYLDLPESRTDDIIEFFADARLIEAEGEVLEATAEDKRQAEQNALSIQREAKRLRQQREKFHVPRGQPSTLYGSLVEMTWPETFQLYEIDELPVQEVLAQLRGGHSPPFYVIEKGKLLSFDIDGLEEEFSRVNAEPVRSISREACEENLPQELRGLQRDVIEDILYRHGIRKHNGAYLFLAKEKAEEGEPRKIETIQGEMKVATPYFEEGRDGDPDGLNFYRHESFYAQPRQLGGSYYVQLGLTRKYTEDGGDVIEGPRAKKLDERHSNPTFNLPPTQFAKIQKIASYFFGPSLTHEESWDNLIQFHGLVNETVNWEPTAEREGPVPTEDVQTDLFNLGDSP